MNLILSPSAIRGLQEISDDTLQTWGAEQDDRYLKGLWGKLAGILPTAGRPRKRLPLHLPREARHLLLV
ncbi:MAG: hypothetical protein RLZZ214_3124 [Verrucomicrobiota bacterium]|jgi:plasmid stabilization system protein ParE